MDKITPKKSNHKWILVSLIIVGIVVFFYAGLAITVNRTKPTGFIRSMIKYLSIPVGLVNSRPIWANDLYNQFEGLKSTQTYMSASTSASTETDTMVLASAFTKTIKDAAVENMLHDNKLKITANDINQSYNNEVTQSGSSQTVESSINKLYGWTPALFKKYVIRINLIHERLREKYAYSSEYNSTAKTTAGQVLALVKTDGSNFSEIAKKYSQDEFATNGGDMGYVSQGTMVKEIEDVAWALNIGQISEVIQSEYGFHIIKILDKKTSAGNTQVKIQEIFIGTPTVEEAITKYLQNAKIRILSRAYAWDKTTQQVVQK